MAEQTLDLRGKPKAEAYRELNDKIRVVLHGVYDEIAAVATINALVHHAFGHLWTAFYRVVEADAVLRVGPYQGTCGCLEIAIGRGVCGTAAEELRSVIGPDAGAPGAHRE